MTVFGGQVALQTAAITVQTEQEMSDIEDYEKIPLSPLSEPCHPAKPLETLPSRTLARLTIGSSCISLLLLLVGSIGNLPVLITEGIHSLTDTLCYLTAWIIDVKSRQSISNQKLLPFGVRRLTVLGGFFIGCFTATSILFVTLENIRQLFDVNEPDPAIKDLSSWAILVGFVELCFNAIVLILHWHGHDHGHSHGHSHGNKECSKDDANTEGALMHAVTDLTTASIVIISSVMQLLVSHRTFVFINILGCCMIFSVMVAVAVKLIKENGRILLQGTPLDFPLDSLLAAINDLDGVVFVVNSRIWQIDVPEKLTGSFIIEIDSESDRKAVTDAIRDACIKFNVTDVIIESR